MTFCYKKIYLRSNQKIPTTNRNFLTRWAVDLHHTRRNGQSGFQAVTQLLDFAHQTHRESNNSPSHKENNPEITSEIVFSPLQSVAPLENRYFQYITPKNLVNRFVDNLHS